ncbi:hypothetical protein AJ78_03575 [Emergomyces pasteurianus Ep9510]|uniref:Uncharacterized protein n=1 Tax=Emergomyces pasteurianus Ep9510 TaxID=1447872 RepID=A0A1J9PJL7_9EURO|nr:hypothetical protein AJ78_03575 [Emergomyces pasteurianus Ep9510]
MKFGYSITFLGLFVLVAQGTPVAVETDLGIIMSRLEHDLEGRSDVGEDGILRSLDRSGNLIDSAKLSSAQLASFAARSLNDEGTTTI